MISTEASPHCGGNDSARDLVAAYYGSDTGEMFDLRGAKNKFRRGKLRARYGKPNPVEHNTEVLFEEEKRDLDSEGLSIQRERYLALHGAIRSLRPRDMRVIWERFFVGYTLEEVGVRMGVTRERIRQIEAKALRMLRHSSRSKNFSA